MLLKKEKKSAFSSAFFVSQVKASEVGMWSPCETLSILVSRLF